MITYYSTVLFARDEEVDVRPPPQENINLLLAQNLMQQKAAILSTLQTQYPTSLLSQMLQQNTTAYQNVSSYFYPYPR